MLFSRFYSLHSFHKLKAWGASLAELPTLQEPVSPVHKLRDTRRHRVFSRRYNGCRGVLRHSLPAARRLQPGRRGQGLQHHKGTRGHPACGSVAHGELESEAGLGDGSRHRNHQHRPSGHIDVFAQASHRAAAHFRACPLTDGTPRNSPCSWRGQSIRPMVALTRAPRRLFQAP